MRVSKESNFSSLYISMGNFETALNSLSGQYSTSIGTINGEKKNISFTDWSDAVSTKLESFSSSELIDGVDKISDDISNGSFKNMCETVTSLKEELKKCKDTKLLISTIKKDMGRVPKTIKVSVQVDQRPSYMGGASYFGGGNDWRTQSKENPAYTKLETSLNKNTELLDGYITECNRLFEILEGVDFSGGGSETFNGSDGTEHGGGGGSFDDSDDSPDDSDGYSDTQSADISSQLPRDEVAYVLADDATSRGNATFEVNGTHFVLINNGNNEYILCTTENNAPLHFSDGEITNAGPPIGKISVESLGEIYSDGKCDAINSAIMDYFASLN